MSAGVIHSFGECSVDVERRELRRAGELQDVQPKVLDLILYLLDERERVVSRSELLDALWGDAAVIEGVLSTAVHAARTALGDSASQAWCIKTVPRKGYRFVAPVDVSGPPATVATPETTIDVDDAWTSDTFVGRGPCLARLNAALAAAAAGRGRVLVISGESGIGKTRVLDEFAARSAADARVLAGRCYEGDGSPPYWPWVQILRASTLEGEPDETLADMGTGASDIAALVPALHELRPDLPEPSGLQTDPSRFRLFESIASYLTNTGKRRPILILIDDLHAADHASQRLLSFLAGEVRYARILVAVTVRDGETVDAVTEETLAELARQSPGERMQLEGLRPEETALLIRRLTGETPSEQLNATIAERSDGNPFFIREIVNLLKTPGHLDDATESLLESPAVPPGVRDVILRRLHRRSPECQGVLACASVLGRSFRADLLESLVELPDDRFAEAVREATAAGFLNVTSASSDAPEGAANLQFTHGLLQETLYAESSPSIRTKWHQRAGEMLETLDDPATPAPAAKLAHHFLLAASPGEAAKAIDYSIRAAEDAIEIHAPDEAVKYYGRALEALDLFGVPDDAQRCELLISLGTAQLKTRRFDASGRESLIDAARLAQEIGEPKQLARAVLEVAAASRQRGPGDSAVIELLEAALEALGDGDAAVRSKLMAALALQRLSPETLHEATSLANDAIALAGKAGDDVTLGETLNLQCTLLSGPEHVASRLGLADSLLELADETQNAELAFFGHRWRMVSTLEIGEIDASDAELLAYRRLANTAREPTAQWHISTVRAMRAFMEGHFDDAERFAVQALRKRRNEATPLTLYTFGAQIMWLRRAQGRLGEVAGAARPGVLGPRIPTTAAFRATRALLDAERGAGKEARQQLDAFVANGLADIPNDFTQLYSLAVLTELCSTLGDVESAEVLYEALLPHAHHNVILFMGTVCLGSVSRYLGQLATLRRAWDVAEGHFADALEMNDRVRAQLFSAETQLDWAEMLHARGTERAAVECREHLQRCLGIVHELGLPSLKTRAMSLAERASA